MAGSHRILAAIGPGGQPSQKNGVESARTSPPTPPDATTGQARSKTKSASPYYAIIVGMNQYRDPWPQAHQVSNRHLKGLIDTLRTTGTFSDSQIRVLHGKHTTRADIEEVLFSWAKNRMNEDSVLFFYFAGHALADPNTGDVFLVPYEGSIHASKKRLISLRSLQRVLATIPTKVAILFLDTPVIQYLGNGEMVGLNGKNPANWGGEIVKPTSKQKSHVIQVRSVSKEHIEDPAKLLSGLLGRADQNQDGRITLSELLQDLRGQTEIIPSLSQNSPQANILLAQ